MALYYAPDSDHVSFDFNNSYAYVPLWHTVSFNFGATVIVNPDPGPDPVPEDTTDGDEGTVPLPAGGKSQVAWTSGASFVKVNPLTETLSLPKPDAAADQVFAIALQTQRGRVDKAFYVTRETFPRLIGGYPGDKAWIALWEGLTNGAEGAVVTRIVTSPVSKWIHLSDAGQWSNPTATHGDTRDFDYAHTKLAILHMECFDEAIMVSLHADALSGSTTPQDSFVTLLLRDSKGEVLFQFYGSLDWAARDEYGQSAYLPDVVSRQTDLVKIIANVDMDATTGLPVFPLTAHIGCDTNGNKRWYTTALQNVFHRDTPTTTGLEALQSAVKRLRETILEFGYIASGGSESVSLLRLLFALACEGNIQMRFDIPGYMSADEACDFAANVGASAYESAHLLHAYWAPITTEDPTGTLGRDYFSTSTMNIGYACRRNGLSNAGGFPTKNLPIAGRDWPLNRMRPQQMQHPNEQALNKLAYHRINPVLHDQFTGGGRYVFRDAITCASADASLKKFIAVVEMSAAIDDAVTRAGQDLLHLPLTVAESRMREFLKALFRGAESAGWLIPSNAPEMRGQSWQMEVKTAPERSYDCLKVSYWLRYDGTARQIFVTQYLSKTLTANQS